MGRLEEEILTTEQRDSQNLTYLLAGEGMFSMTGYKVMQSQEKNGFVKCRRITQNGKPKLFYDIAPYQCLQYLLPQMKPEEFLTVLSHLSELLLQVNQNGFMRCDHIPLDFGRIFVRQDSLKVFLLYLPLEWELPEKEKGKQIAQLKQEIRAAYEQNPALLDDGGRTFLGILEQSVYTLEEFHQVLEAAELPSRSRAGSPVPDGENPFQKYFPDSSTLQQSGRLEAASAPAVETAGTEKKKGLFSRVFHKNEKAGKAPAKTPAPQPVQTVQRGGAPSGPLQEEAEGGATEVLVSPDQPERLRLVGANTPESFQLVIQDPEYKIGKKQDLVQGWIPFNNAVSRLHCKIVLRNGRHYVVDLGSANGTFVNGKRLDANREVPLKPGDRLRLANSDFLVQTV